MVCVYICVLGMHKINRSINQHVTHITWIKQSKKQERQVV